MHQIYSSQLVWFDGTQLVCCYHDFEEDCLPSPRLCPRRIPRNSKRKIWCWNSYLSYFLSQHQIMMMQNCWSKLVLKPLRRGLMSSSIFCESCFASCRFFHPSYFCYVFFLPPPLKPFADSNDEMHVERYQHVGFYCCYCCWHWWNCRSNSHDDVRSFSVQFSRSFGTVSTWRRTPNVSPPDFSFFSRHVLSFSDQHPRTFSEWNCRDDVGGSFSRKREKKNVYMKYLRRFLDMVDWRCWLFIIILIEFLLIFDIWLFVFFLRYLRCWDLSRAFRSS